MPAQWTQNRYGFREHDHTWRKLRVLLGMEENQTAFDKIMHDVRCLELKHFTIEALDDHGQMVLFDLVKAELKKKEPTLFVGAHGDRCLVFIFGLIRQIYKQRRWRHIKQQKESSFESASPAIQTRGCGSSTAAFTMSSSSQPIVRSTVKTSISHAPGRTKDIRKSMRPVVLLTRGRTFVNTAARNRSHESYTDALPQCRSTRIDSVKWDDRMGFDSCDSLTGQYFAESERSASSSVPNGFWDSHSGFKSATQTTVSSLQSSSSDNIAGSSTLRSVFRAVPQVKGPRRMSGPLDASGLFHAFQRGNRPVETPVPTHERQRFAFSGSQSTDYSSLTSEDYFDYFQTSSPYGHRWEPRKSDPSLSGDLRKKEQLEKPVADAPKPSLAVLSSKSADHSFVPKAPSKESGIAGIHRFLSKCHPPMMQHILRFVEFGCTTTEYLRGVSTWPAEQRHKLLLKIMQPERGGLMPQMDIAVLENQFETYFKDDDV